MDAVDLILAQWARERPDLDVRAMASVGRLSRIAKHCSDRMGETFARYGLNGAGFDVLATLRRSGPPHALSAGELMSSMMITSGTMTNRIDRLVKLGLVARSADPHDARKAVVRLTREGFDHIEKAVEAHAKTQQALLAGLTNEEKKALDRLLGKWMASIEQT